MSSTWKAKSAHLVLLALKDSPKHGYEITKYVKNRSNGFFSIGYSSLYPTMHSLEKAGFIAGEWQAIGAKEKKVYKITKKGLRELKSISSEYFGFIEAFNLMLGTDHV